MPSTNASAKKVQPRKTPKQQRAAERVELIIASYRKLLDGDTNITTNSIAREAGIPVSSLYQYFPNKEAIASEVYARWAQQGIEVLKQRQAEARSVDNWREYFNLDQPNFFGEIVGAKIVHQLAPIMSSTPELREVQRNYLRTMIDILTETIRILGSDWPDKPLRNIVSLIIELNTTVFHHMARQGRSDADETHSHWRVVALGLMERCISTPYDQLEHTKKQSEKNRGFK